MTKPKTKKEKPKAFRIQYKFIGLTYSQCPIEKEVLLERLQGILSLSGYQLVTYYIVQEFHQDGRPHLHAWIELGQKPNIQNCNYFDIDEYHPNIGKYKKNWIWNYLKKFDKEPVTNVCPGYIQLAIDGQYDAAVEQVQQLEPRTYVCFKTKIESNLKALGKRKREPKVFPPPIDGMVMPEGWEPTKKTLIICGDTDIGKTNWAKTWCSINNKSWMKICQIDKLREYDGEDVIIFDDCEFAHTPRTNQIHVTTVEEESQVHCRYSPAEIPPGVIRIFTCNPGCMPVNLSDPAINRRCHLWCPTGSLYKIL